MEHINKTIRIGTQEEAKQNLVEAQIDKLEYKAHHVRDPLKQKSDDWQETSDRWLIVIGKQEFSYFTGSGHRVYNPSHTRGVWRGYNESYYNHIKNKNLTENGYMELVKMSKAVEPKIKDVLYSLASDSDALEYQFSEWCDNLGYDLDSIEAKKIYESCQENGFKLKRLGLDIAELQEFFQDY